MDSRPPATAMAISPARNWSAAIMMAFMPEPHILLMVVVGTLVGRPAPSAAWRAGAWPSPAGNTQPMMTSCTSAAAMPAFSSAPLMAALPSCGAVAGASAPWKAPMGVRCAATMTTSWLMISPLWSIAAAQATIEHINESIGDFGGVEAGVLAIPGAHPVERAGEGEAVMRVSQARIEPSATPASMRARMRRSMPALSSLILRLRAAPRCWSSARSMHQPKSPTIAAA